jgi:hypothetical protein
MFLSSLPRTPSLIQKLDGTPKVGFLIGKKKNKKKLEMVRIVNYTQYIKESIDWKIVIKVSNEEEYDKIANHLTRQRYKWHGGGYLLTFCPVQKSKLHEMTFYLYTLKNKFIAYGGAPDIDDNYAELLTVKEYIEKYPIEETIFNPNDPYDEEDWE